MSSKIKITKEEILDIAFNIVKNDGMEGLNVREIAKRLNCSVQPIYYQFKNIDDLKSKLEERIVDYFYEFLTKINDTDIPKYKQTGINYIKFAKKEPKLFNLLFLSKSNMSIENFVSSSENNYDEYEKIIKVCTKLDSKDVKNFHIKMWIFTHGLATLIASSTFKITDEEISELLTAEYQALLSAEKKKKEED